MEQQNSQARTSTTLAAFPCAVVRLCLSAWTNKREEGAQCKQLSVYKLEPRQYNKQANILRCDVKWPLKNSLNFLRN